jgi:MFS family permease
MPFTGWAIIRHGSHRITLFALLAYCILVPLIPVLPNVGFLFALFLLEGIVTGMLDVAMNAQAVMVEQQYRRPIMTSFHALFSIGTALGALTSALFVELNFTLQNHFLIIVAVALLTSIWAVRNLIHEKPDPSLKHDGPLFRLPNAALLGIGIITFCCMLGEGAMSNWSVGFMEEIAGASKTVALFGLIAFASAMTLGRIFGDRFRQQLGDKKMIVLGGLIASAGLSAALIFPLPEISILGFFLVGLGLSTIVPIAYSIAGNTSHVSPGVGLAMVTTVGYSGFLVGPPVIGFLADWKTLQIALAFVCILLVAMTILGIRYKPKAAKV